MTLLKLLASLTPNVFHEFRLEKFELAKSLRGVRFDISNHRLSLTDEIGMAIGKFARALGLRENLLEIFMELMVADWKMRDPKRAIDKYFTHQVRQGFSEEEDKGK